MCWTARRPSRKHRARRDGLRPEEQLVSERVVNAAPGGEANVSRESLYSRRMPGGGSVRVELLVSNPTDVTTERLSGRVVIERPALRGEWPVACPSAEHGKTDAPARNHRPLWHRRS